MRDLRAEIHEHDQDAEQSVTSLPNEMIYADDSDFISTDITRDEKIQNIAKPILERHSLIVNEDKWEKTTITKGTAEEEKGWRNTKKLGSLLGDYEDMKRREQLSTAVMKSTKKIWPTSKLRINKKLKIYKSIVKPILTYNMQTWGLTQAQTEELDRIHRRQLRWVWNDRNKKNIDLYLQSKEVPLSNEMRNARWRALGHFLRLDVNTPCQKAMKYYFEVPKNSKKYPGQQKTTLPTVINNGIKACAKTHKLPVLKFENFADLIVLKHIASDRSKWSDLASLICNIAKGKERI